MSSEVHKAPECNQGLVRPTIGPHDGSYGTMHFEPQWKHDAFRVLHEAMRHKTFELNTKNPSKLVTLLGGYSDKNEAVQLTALTLEELGELRQSDSNVAKLSDGEIRDFLLSQQLDCRNEEFRSFVKIEMNAARGRDLISGSVGSLAADRLMMRYIDDDLRINAQPFLPLGSSALEKTYKSSPKQDEIIAHIAMRYPEYLNVLRVNGYQLPSHLAQRGGVERFAAANTQFVLDEPTLRPFIARSRDVNGQPNKKNGQNAAPDQLPSDINDYGDLFTSFAINSTGVSNSSRILSYINSYGLEKINMPKIIAALERAQQQDSHLAVVQVVATTTAAEQKAYPNLASARANALAQVISRQTGLPMSFIKVGGDMPEKPVSGRGNAAISLLPVTLAGVLRKTAGARSSAVVFDSASDAQNLIGELGAVNTPSAKVQKYAAIDRSEGRPVSFDRQYTPSLKRQESPTIALAKLIRKVPIGSIVTLAISEATPQPTLDDLLNVARDARNKNIQVNAILTFDAAINPSVMKLAEDIANLNQNPHGKVMRVVMLQQAQ